MDGFGVNVRTPSMVARITRFESTTKVMPQDMYDERIRAHQPQLYAWERLTADGVTLADLNENLIRKWYPSRY